MALCLAYLTSCSSNEAKTTLDNSAEAFVVTSPIVIDTSFVQEYVADIQAVQNVEIRSRLNGFIEKIHVDEGQSVKEGQLLFTISSRHLKEELLKANAQLKNAVAEAKIAKVELKNARLLVEKNIISATELEMAEAKYEATQAKIQEAQSAVASVKLNLSFAEIKAPFSGTINRIPLKMGSLLEEGQLLTTISNTEDVFAYFNVSEKEYLRFTKEKKADRANEVSLILADGNAFKHQGIIETIESEIDKNTGNLAFRARFPNHEHLLRHGASGKLLLPKKLDNALVIPQKSTFEIQENMYVFVLDKDNSVKMRNITVKQRLQHLFVVASGVSPNDRIIYEGIQLVKEGDKVIPQMRPMRNLMSQLAQQ